MTEKTKKRLLAWIDKRYKAEDDPDGEGSMLESGDADEGVQARLQMLDEFRGLIEKM